jgi:Multicopper oxidase
MMRRPLVRSEQIANPVSRVDALFMLAQAEWPSAREAWSSAIGHLVAAARTASRWKVPLVLRDVVGEPGCDGTVAASQAGKCVPSWVVVRVPFAIVGDFVYHCHILGLEDAGMMAKISVVPARRP